MVYRYNSRVAKGRRRLQSAPIVINSFELEHVKTYCHHNVAIVVLFLVIVRK